MYGYNKYFLWEVVSSPSLFCHLQALHRDISIETIHGWNTCGQ